MINPINHMRTADDPERYRAEPYAVAVDARAIPLEDDGQAHEVTIVLGSEPEAGVPAAAGLPDARRARTN